MKLDIVFQPGLVSINFVESVVDKVCWCETSQVDQNMRSFMVLLWMVYQKTPCGRLECSHEWSNRTQHSAVSSAPMNGLTEHNMRPFRVLLWMHGLTEHDMRPFRVLPLNSLQSQRPPIKNSQIPQQYSNYLYSTYLYMYIVFYVVHILKFIFFLHHSC